MSRGSGSGRAGPRKRLLQVLLTDEEYDAVDFVASEMHYSKSSFARLHLLRAVAEFNKTTKEGGKT